jgi:hypothetical protein
MPPVKFVPTGEHARVMREYFPGHSIAEVQEALLAIGIKRAETQIREDGRRMELRRHYKYQQLKGSVVPENIAEDVADQDYDHSLDLERLGIVYRDARDHD